MCFKRLFFYLLFLWCVFFSARKSKKSSRGKYRLRGPKNRRPARWRAMRNRLTWQGITGRIHPKGYPLTPPDTPETYIKGEKLRNLYRVFSFGMFLGFNLGFMGWNWHVFPEKWMVGRQSFWILAYFLWWTVSCREVNVMERDEGFPIVHPTGMISTRRHRFISPDIPSIPKQLRSNLLGVIIHDPNSYEMLNTDLTKYMMNSIVFLWGPNFEVAFFCILFFFSPSPRLVFFPMWGDWFWWIHAEVGKFNFGSTCPLKI